MSKISLRIHFYRTILISEIFFRWLFCQMPRIYTCKQKRFKTKSYCNVHLLNKYFYITYIVTVSCFTTQISTQNWWTMMDLNIFIFRTDEIGKYSATFRIRLIVHPELFNAVSNEFYNFVNKISWLLSKKIFKKHRFINTSS